MEQVRDYVGKESWADIIMNYISLTGFVLKTGFQFVKGGKLFGLAGGKFVVPAPPTGDQGFDALAMWKPDGTIQNYVYHHAQTSQYGEGGDWDPSKSKNCARCLDGYNHSCSYE
ncbi:MAG: hypothetical protein HC905_25760 [Bacteroidales bacterium]|nr:hypothetical protein [Bacteroidales bacterium]